MKVTYKEIPLRPYPGVVKVFNNLAQFRAYYEHKTGERYGHNDETTGGRYIRLEGKDSSRTEWIVYARRPHVLAHEFAHVLLQLFEQIGSNPGDGNGEPFCYMLSQLMLEAR